MSKIGKTPIALPSGVTVKVENNKVIIQGAKSKKRSNCRSKYFKSHSCW